MIQINDINDPRVSFFNGLKSKLLLKDQLFIADSVKVINQYSNLTLSGSSKFVKVFGTKDQLNQISFIDQLDPKNVLFAEKDLIQQVVGHRLHQGVMGLGKIPSELKLKDLIEGEESILVLNGLTSPENVGEIVRTATAFGLKRVVFDHKTCHPYTRRCVRVSMGNIAGLNFYKSDDLIRDLTSLRQSGANIVGTANVEKAKPLSQYHWKAKKNVIIMGSEGHGIEKSIFDLCEDILKISISTQVDSLNVASAAGIVIHHLQSNKALLKI